MYRNYVAAGKQVLAKGWQVRDGGWRVVILDPTGMDLGGEFAGVHVGVGAQALFGNYNIAETGPNGRIRNERIIWYRAGQFFEPTPLADLHAICELSLSGPEFPNGVEGMAFITNNFYFLGLTEMKIALRNVLTFGDSQPQNGLGPDSLWW